MQRTRCAICGSDAEPVAQVQGKFVGREFELRRCRECGFAFVANPWLDYAAIYDDRYYAGEGADPMLDYTFELTKPASTLRRHEWKGIVEAVGDLIELRPDTEWLDFGCGNGGLVRYIRDEQICNAVGFDEGAIVE